MIRLLQNVFLSRFRYGDSLAKGASLRLLDCSVVYLKVDHEMPDASMLLARHDPASNFSALVLGLPKQLVPKWGKTQFTCQELVRMPQSQLNELLVVWFILVILIFIYPKKI